MRTTESRDGQVRATVVIRHRVGAVDVVNAACSAVWTAEDDEELADALAELTSTRVTEELRTLLYTRGADFYAALEGTYPFDRRLGTVARRCADLFPQLDFTPLLDQDYPSEG
jgi:hypothetical protein